MNLRFMSPSIKNSNSMWKSFPGLDINNEFIHKKKLDYSIILFDCIERVTGLSKDELKLGRRHRQHVEARYAYWKIMRDMFKTITLEELGRVFSRDHATVLHAFDKIKEWMSKKPNGTVMDAAFYHKYTEIKRLFNEFIQQ